MTRINPARPCPTIAVGPAALALMLVACGSPATTPANDTAAAVTQANGDVVAPGPGAPPAPAPIPTASAANIASPATAAPTQEAYLGRWIGVEGMYLNVTAKPSGGVKMEMQYDLDHKGTYDGSVTAEGLRFMRDGKAMTAVPTDGDATGLKWLAGKKNCLTVQPGEGYCRA